MICPYCRSEVDDALRFCTHCGAPLREKRGPRYCVYCRTEIKGYRKNCPRCGAPNPVPARPQPEEEYPATKAAQVGYEAYRAFSAMLRVFFGLYLLLTLSAQFVVQACDYTVYFDLLWLGRALLLMLVGAVLQFVFALFLRGRSWAIASLAITGALCLLGLALMLMPGRAIYPMGDQALAKEARLAYAVMFGLGLPMFQGALSFCRATYKSTALRFLLVEVVWFVLTIAFLYLGIFTLHWAVRGVVLTVLGPIAALAVSLALNRRIFRAASRPAPPQAANRPAR